MSWDSYIDNLIQHSADANGTKHADRACIIGIDGGAAWTTATNPSGLQLNPQEAANIARAFKSKDFSTFMANGIHAEGKKYQFLRVQDDKLVLAKKKGEGALTLQCSKTAIVLAHTGEGQQQGNVNKAVGTIADYLESQNM